MSYNGWSNWETWDASLYLDSSSEYEECAEEGVPVDEVVSVVADRLESFVDDMLSTVDVDGLLLDLISSSIESIDFYELAESGFNKDDYIEMLNENGYAVVMSDSKKKQSNKCNCTSCSSKRKCANCKNAPKSRAGATKKKR